uniref:Putative disease resistance RPP13-like protein 4 isoform X5 n=1 Tax=Davidia involucrata TaxID=16924 RepID=A0A5B7BQF2_DAVIN
MPTIQRKPADTIPVLLERVSDVITRATTGQPNQAQADPNERLVTLFRNLEEELKGMEDWFPKFKRCEEVLMSEFNFLRQDIHDDVFDNLTHHKDKIDDKLKSISGRLGQIHSIISRIQLPEVDEIPAQSQKGARSEDQCRKVSNDWLSFSVEANILVSPAMANLQLSYDVLDIKLKLCLLCFSVFPEKAVIKKRPLIYWWIAEGLVNRSKEKTAQEVGEGIFKELIEKGLIVPYYKNKKSPIVDFCTMHPWIRRMLISVAAGAEFFDFNDKGEIVDVYSKSRRACLVSGNQGFSDNNNNNNNNNNTSSKEDELVTMFNVNAQYLSFKAELFLKLKKLVILQLGRWQNSARHHIEVENEEFLKDLWAQKHLKYLSLQGISRITALPSSIAQCINLEILDLRACHNLERLPSDISSLRKLTHLDVSECYLLESMPKGLEKLSSLQVLKGFVIGHSRKNPCKLGDLVQLKKLRKLSIHIGSEAVIEKEELNKVKEISSLRVLTISWGGVALASKSGVQSSSNVGAKLTRTATLTVKSFSFPPQLEKLDLRCIPRSPEWLRPSGLQRLKRLYIRGGELDSLVSEEDEKWNVEILRLKYLKNLKIEVLRLKEDFPYLTYFEKVRCHQIAESKYENDVEWERDEGWEALTSKL